jgi:hypothetical protein
MVKTTLKNQDVDQLKLIFIGTDSWDLYASNTGTVWAIPKPLSCPSVKKSYFGNKHHLLKLMRSGDDLGEITQDGLEFCCGLHHRFLPTFNLLSF